MYFNDYKKRNGGPFSEPDVMIETTELDVGKPEKFKISIGSGGGGDYDHFVHFQNYYIFLLVSI